MIHPNNRLPDYNSNLSSLDPFRLVIPAHCAGLRLDQALQQLLPDYSRSRLQQWIRAGQVLVNGVAVEPKHKVWGGEEIQVMPNSDPQVTAFQSEAIPLDIVYEDDTLLVINKPAGLVVHPGSGNWQGTMLNALLQHAPELTYIPRAGIVHRLDKETSGLLVVAKTLTAQTDLVRQLQARTVKRHYLAVATGLIEADGLVNAPIGRHPRQRTKMAVVERGKPAVTHYRILERFTAATLLECQLETGRTHQIRVHLQSIGHPLVGDPVYGSKRNLFDFNRQALHALKLGILHPLTQQKMEWQVELPADMQQLIATLRENAT